MHQRKARKKTINFRLPVALALSLACGIIYSLALAFFGLDGVYILIPSAAILAAAVVYAVVTKRLCGALFIILIAAFFAAGAVYSYALYFNFCLQQLPENQLCTVSGRVESVGQTSSGAPYLIVTRAFAEDIKLNGKVIVYLRENGGDYCSAGYEVSFLAVLEKESFFSEGEVGYRAANGIEYYATVYGGLDATWHFSVFGGTTNALRGMLYDNLDYETASVCFALLTGDSSLMSKATLSSFRYGGIAHMFAVSGLHIGVVFGAMTAVFKRLKVNRFVSAVFRMAFIVFYSGVCGFSPSSVRAVVMCAVSLAATLSYKKYDSLNAISLAAIILLFINPLYIADVGFVMSFSACLGIIFLQHNASRILSFLPKKLREGLTISLSATAGTTPVQLTCFNYVSAAGLLLNVIVVPVMSVLYTLLFFCSLCGLILPFAAPALINFSAAPFEFIINLAVECGFENSILPYEAGYWIFLPFIVLILATTDKINLRLCARGAALSAAAVALTVGLVSIGVPSVQEAYITFGTGTSGSAAIITTQSGTVAIVTEDYRGSVLQTRDDLDALVITGGDDNLAAYYWLESPCDNVFVNAGAIGIPQIGSAKITYSNNFTLCGVAFSFENDALVFNCCGVTASFVTQEGFDTPTDIKLVRGDEGGVLYLEDGDYLLDYHGKIQLLLKNGGYGLCTVLGREG